MKPYLIINVVNGSVVVVRQRNTKEEALSLAVSMSKEQCDEPEEDIRQLLEENDIFVPCNEGFEVCITQVAD